MNIIITSAGQRVSLVKSFQKELQQLGLDSKVYTTDLNPTLAPACHISYKSFKVPKVNNQEYIDKLLSICINNSIKLVIPTIDTELKTLSKNKDLFSENGIQVLVSDYPLIKRCRDKRETNDLFISHNIEVPEQYSVNSLIYPTFVKPYDGSRSEGIFIAENESHITNEHLHNEKLMFMEYISDAEYNEFTVDCYYDKHSNLKCVVPRQRLLVRAGEVNKGVTRKNIIVEKFKENLSILMGARGCLTIQVFLHKEKNIIKGIEINPRFGGGYPLTYLSGANYTKWVIQEYLLDYGIAEFYDWEDNLLMLRYDAEVLVSDYNK